MISTMILITIIIVMWGICWLTITVIIMISIIIIFVIIIIDIVMISTIIIVAITIYCCSDTQSTWSCTRTMSLR